MMELGGSHFSGTVCFMYFKIFVSVSFVFLSMRTLCRSLQYVAKNPCGNVHRSLYEVFIV